MALKMTFLSVVAEGGSVAKSVSGLLLASVSMGFHRECMYAASLYALTQRVFYYKSGCCVFINLRVGSIIFAISWFFLS